MNHLVISAHDYRSRRRAGIHFVAEELAKRGMTRFFSCQYSFLSKLKSDPRISLDNFANRVTVKDNIECYLWKTLIQPFSLHAKSLCLLEKMMFEIYLYRCSPVLVKWICEAEVIFFESGIAPIFFDLVKRLNPSARTVYVASDDLSTINVAFYVKKVFERVAPDFDMLCLKSKIMAANIPGNSNKYVIPHGFDYSIVDHSDPSPYGEGIHAVSVGSMLFDIQFFQIASELFPQITFHVIGSGMERPEKLPDNVRFYGEMPYLMTLPYIKHATLGLAPYFSEDLPAYLADTSLKLMQYDFFQLPAICPVDVVGDYDSRFGYIPRNSPSIDRAIRTALAAPTPVAKRQLNWSAAVDRMLNPKDFPETKLGAS